MKNFFVKSHGLGNDYIILDSNNISFQLSEKNIIKICDVHFGIGSDGILLMGKSSRADFGVRIFNPDGSEAEKSGNGLRIFAKYLNDYHFAKTDSFTIETLGGNVCAKVIKKTGDKANIIKIDMGKANFNSKEIPVKSDNTECIDEKLQLKDTSYIISCVSMGNPHCVVVKDELSVDEIMKYGSEIENNPKFPNRINVQFVKVISPKVAEVIIWERGAGYTLASGSSSSAVAAVLVKKGLTGRNIDIKMPGGTLKLEVDKDWSIHLTGEVKEIASGYLSDEFIAELN